MKIDIATNQLCRAIEIAWNSSKPAEMVRLMSRDAVWRQDQQVHVGRNEIWNAFETLWRQRLHFSLSQWVHSIDKNNIGVKLVSEWQHSVHGNWFRASGEGAYALDSEGYVCAMETQQQDQPISLAQRNLPLPGLSHQQTPVTNAVTGGSHE